MSKFFEELWESIFTPGPTPTLLIATNVTFAVLQVVLFILLVATYSVHFVVLSLLSAGLWWAINWFARELKVAQQLQEEAEEEQKRKDRRRAVVAAATAAPAETDSETEVEGTPAPETASARTTGACSSSRGEARQRTAAQTQAQTQTNEGLAAQPPAQASHASQASHGSSQHLSSSRSGVSTEDEWEKVSENEK
ncbi:SMK killer toxin resistance protein [Sporothrix curviconia]|uniref:SMK killer toxin resistance protein n=1 Tax=Sporothrix curviconia TaxID=1260050 RepID=A0ABP0B4J5_9PEZI